MTALTPTPPAATFLPFGDLFAKGWALFTSRAKIFALLGLLAAIGSLIGYAIPGSALTGIYQVVVIGLQLFLGLAALLVIVANQQPLGQLLRATWSRFGPYLIVSIVAGLAIWGGFVLLFVPGVIVGTNLVFAAYVFAAEGLRGREALARSHAYVTGVWWEIFWRVLVVGIAAALVNIVLVGLARLPFGQSGFVGGAVSTFLSTLVGAWSACLVYQLYVFVKERHAGAPLPAPTGFFANYKVLAIVGILGIVLSIPVFLYFLAPLGSRNGG